MKYKDLKMSKGTKVIGAVMRPQTPMLTSFEESTVEYIVDYLYQALEQSYSIIDLFGQLDTDIDDFGE